MLQTETILKAKINAISVARSCAQSYATNEYLDSIAINEEMLTNEPNFLSEDLDEILNGGEEDILNEFEDEEDEDEAEESCRPQKKGPIVWNNLFESSSRIIKFPFETQESVRGNRHMVWRMNAQAPCVIRKTVSRAGFKVFNQGSHWIGYWGAYQPSDRVRKISSYQRINHIPGSFQYGRKDLLFLNIEKLNRIHGYDLTNNFFPQTFLLPRDLNELKKHFDQHKFWILKPPCAARGIGIKVVHSWRQVPKKKPMVISHYIDRPLLINDKKFDLRIYVLVPSILPLTLFLYDKGLVRFASSEYSRKKCSLNERYKHLTNYSVNKKNESCSIPGEKWTLEQLEEHFNENGMDFSVVVTLIEKIIVKTIASGYSKCLSTARMTLGKQLGCCFELLGFDILLDENLKPWLMEVNISPSLSCTSDVDWKVKSPLMVDSLNTLGIDMECLEKRAASMNATPGNIPAQNTITKLTLRDYTDCTVEQGYFMLNQTEIDILKTFEERVHRQGDFKCIFPSKTNRDLYCLIENNPENALLNWWIQFDQNKRISILCNPENYAQKEPPSEKPISIPFLPPQPIINQRSLKKEKKIILRKSKTTDIPNCANIMRLSEISLPLILTEIKISPSVLQVNSEKKKRVQTCIPDRPNPSSYLKTSSIYGDFRTTYRKLLEEQTNLILKHRLDHNSIRSSLLVMNKRDKSITNSSVKGTGFRWI